jgi:hypothetical protein
LRERARILEAASVFVADPAQRELERLSPGVE